jgi:hypothetical protein
MRKQKRIAKTGQAEAEKILAIGKSNAESYKLSVEAMGGNNFTQLKVTEAIGLNKIKVIPDVLDHGQRRQCQQFYQWSARHGADETNIREESYRTEG